MNTWIRFVWAWSVVGLFAGPCLAIVFMHNRHVIPSWALPILLSACVFVTLCALFLRLWMWFMRGLR